MSVQKNIKLEVNRIQTPAPSRLGASRPVQSEINIQVSDDWVITGHYCDQILQTVTLIKNTEVGTN